jgi:signal transduction histidine kinase
MIDLLAEGEEVAVSVSDSGKGMSADFIRNQLFQPFASTKDGGFGVGAFEARSLICGLGGRLEVDSLEGEGTCFTIYLPLASTGEVLPDERMRA